MAGGARRQSGRGGRGVGAKVEEGVLEMWVAIKQVRFQFPFLRTFSTVRQVGRQINRTAASAAADFALAAAAAADMMYTPCNPSYAAANSRSKHTKWQQRLTMCECAWVCGCMCVCGCQRSCHSHTRAAQKERQRDGAKGERVSEWERGRVRSRWRAERSERSRVKCECNKCCLPDSWLARTGTKQGSRVRHD